MKTHIGALQAVVCLAAILLASSGGGVRAQLTECPVILTSPTFTIGAGEVATIFVTNFCPTEQPIPVEIVALQLTGQNAIPPIPATIQPGATFSVQVSYRAFIPTPPLPPPRLPVRFVVTPLDESLTKALISSIELSNRECIPKESVSLCFARIKLDYTEKKP